MDLLPSSASPRIRVGGFVVRQNTSTEVLLMRRYKPERGVYFVIPGGSLEHGESLEQGARRELLEECGLSFRLGQKLYESCNPQSRRIAHYFLAEHQSGEPCLDSSAPEFLLQSRQNQYAPTWVRLEQVAYLPLFPSVIRLRLAEDIRLRLAEDLQLRLAEDLHSGSQQPVKLIEHD